MARVVLAGSTTAPSYKTERNDVETATDREFKDQPGDPEGRPIVYLALAKV
jgi:hypothetical protein